MIWVCLSLYLALSNSSLKNLLPSFSATSSVPPSFFLTGLDNRHKGTPPLPSFVTVAERVKTTSKAYCTQVGAISERVSRGSHRRTTCN